MNTAHRLALSVSAVALAAAATPALAAQQPTPAEEAPNNAPPSGQVEDAEGEEIVVTGIRGSLQAAVRAKRNSDVVADFITAEDIGKFPDKNVAEALQRVPGVVINREFGEGERVSLRGTAPNLTKTLVNGHAIATADWFVLEQLSSTRSFNYLTLPAEIVGQLDVYKSPQADVEEGGIGGTINVHTRDPLDLDPFTVSASAQLVYSELRDSVDPQVSGLVSWRNKAETLGILVGGVYQKRDIRRDGVEVLTYIPYELDGETVQVPGLIGSALFQQERERYGGNIGVQFRPTNALEINLTGLYSRFGANNFNQNYLAWGSNALGGGGTLTDAVVENGTVVSGRIDSVADGRAAVFDAIDRTAFAKTWSGDLDLNWRPTERTTVHFKAGYTEAHGDTEQQPFYEGGAPGGFTFDLTGRTPQVSFTGFDPTNPEDLFFDFGSFHQITNSDKELYFYADFEQAVTLGPINALKFGAKYTDHERVTRFLATAYGTFFLPVLNSGCGGPCTSGDFFGGDLTPDDFLDNIAEPGTFRDFWQVDRRLLRRIYESQPDSVRQRFILPSDNYSVNEKTYGGYAMARFGSAGDRYRGNVGVRVVRTDQTSRGNQIGVPATTPGVITTSPFGNYLPVSIERSYTDVLPSANVTIDLTNKLLLRLGAGRVIARADYTDIVPRVSLNAGALTGSGGSPFVNPYRANQADLSLEWYPDRETIVAAAFYYKDVKSYVTDVPTTETFPVEGTGPTQSINPNPARCTPLTGGLFDCQFDITRRSSGQGGKNKGFEFQASRNLFGGFGAIVNYTYSDAELDNGGEVQGNSKHALNLTGFFENALLSARLSYNYRSKFFITFDRASPLNQAATESLDGSLSVKVTDNVSLTADAINLTNEKIVQYSGTRNRPRAIYDNGRQFYLGARFRF